jgi:hypothetical protein
MGAELKIGTGAMNPTHRFKQFKQSVFGLSVNEYNLR